MSFQGKTVVFGLKTLIFHVYGGEYFQRYVCHDDIGYKLINLKISPLPKV